MVSSGQKLRARYKEKFFQQLEQDVKPFHPEKYNWIKTLFDWASQKEDFEVGWGGRKIFTMRFFVKKWNKDPIGIGADGIVTVGYQDNPSLLSVWKHPKVVESKLRKMFHHGEHLRWPSAPLKTPADFENVKEALEILADFSKRYELDYERGRIP